MEASPQRPVWGLSLELHALAEARTLGKHRPDEWPRLRGLKAPNEKAERA
eukprot:CAMPEP_0168475348 /NCGR_PEP_ID=MMETSP0228-20121227/61314_1 /TAXON_ID=133427 /ORGANISM="Protoceratium reticulatum, Strain CCCM 535 (=CCMP 1889)" /LENGTH=49 /DNA_ID=CAMNT_0008491411 /DNA_START=1 /DNA_END=150 /DNA_ORIENTATION=-